MTACPVCAAPVKQNRTYCGKSCAAQSRGAAFQGITCDHDGCDTTAYCRGLCKRHYRRLQTYGEVTPDPPTEGERFAAKFTPGDPDECWPWTGESHPFGYGIFRTYRDGRRTKHYAHRYALKQQGHSTEGLVVRHRCDNPPCVNPNHLLTGTQADNMQDAVDRNRLDTSGLRGIYQIACRVCEAPFAGLSSHRYCSTECRDEAVAARMGERQRATLRRQRKGDAA